MAELRLDARQEQHGLGERSADAETTLLVEELEERRACGVALAAGQAHARELDPGGLGEIELGVVRDVAHGLEHEPRELAFPSRVAQREEPAERADERGRERVERRVRAWEAHR